MRINVLHPFSKLLTLSNACLLVMVWKRPLLLGVCKCFPRVSSCCRIMPIRCVCIHFCLQVKMKLKASKALCWCKMDGTSLPCSDTSHGFYLFKTVQTRCWCPATKQASRSSQKEPWASPWNENCSCKSVHPSQWENDFPPALYLNGTQYEKWQRHVLNKGDDQRRGRAAMLRSRFSSVTTTPMMTTTWHAVRHLLGSLLRWLRVHWIGRQIKQGQAILGDVWNSVVRGVGRERLQVNQQMICLRYSEKVSAVYNLSVFSHHSFHQSSTPFGWVASCDTHPCTVCQYFFTTAVLYTLLTGFFCGYVTSQTKS